MEPGTPFDDVAVLLPAAGLGLRLGRGPKALLELNGRSLLGWLCLGVAAQTRELVVAAPPGLEREFTRHVPGHARVISGGATRQETVRLLARAAEAELLVVHDAARPFLPRAVFERAVQAARETGSASAALPVTDTLIRRSDGNTVDREDLLAVQTPQAFRRELLLAAHDAAAADDCVATDDAALVRRLGAEVAIVEGSPWLIKLTRPGDMVLAGHLAVGWVDTGVTDAA